MVLVTPAAAEYSEGNGNNGGVNNVATEEQPHTKTVTLETEVSKTEATKMERRLVEYFVVVSSVARNNDSNISTIEEEEEKGANADAAVPPPSNANNNRYDDDDEFVDDYDFQPVITARYPLEDHEGNPLHENVTFFCHPSGGIRLRTEQTMPKVHYFVATGGYGKQMYGTCLTLWEPYIITTKPNDDDDDDNNTEGGPAPHKKEVYLPKCLVILSSHPYLMAFREYLTQLNRLSKMEEMTLPIERYIANFCAEIPAPPPGSFEVQTTILDSVIKVWSPPHNQPIPWVSLPFSHLFQCLDIDNIVLCWHCLALERQVLLTSTQLSLLTSCAEVLLSLLFPLKWSHAYIPLLPHFLIPILSAPMPFLCGINKANLADALCDLNGECVVVDLDKNLVTMGPSTDPLPPLPKSHERDLKAKLELNVGMVFREARSLTKNDDFSDRGAKLPTHVKLMADGMWESRLCLFDEAFHLAFTPENARKNILNGNDASLVDDTDSMKVHIMTAAERQKLKKQSEWDAVQEAFLETYVFLLKNYRKYLVFPSKDNAGSYGGAGFRSKEFVQAQQYNTQDFLEQLVGTQMFDEFITKRLYGSGEADVTFFDMAVGRFLKHQGIMSSMNRAISGSTNAIVDPGSDGPLLQSALTKRSLKTIVPPEPSGDDLPPIHSNEGGRVGSAIITTATTDGDVMGFHSSSSGIGSGGDKSTTSGNTTSDDQSVSSNVSDGTQSTRGTNRTGTSKGTKSSLAAESTMGSPMKRKAYRSIQDKAEEILERHRGLRYTYPTFPSEFQTELFGKPRPMPSAVIAEFERQRKDAARFRRKNKDVMDVTGLQQSLNSSGTNAAGGKITLVGAATGDAANEPPPSAEVSTFTLFFMAFSAMVGKELLEISHNPLLHTNEREIFSTYTHGSTIATQQTATGVDGSEDDDTQDGKEEENVSQEEITFEESLTEEEKLKAAEMKTQRPNVFGDDDPVAAQDAEDSDDAKSDIALSDEAQAQAEAQLIKEMTADYDDETQGAEKMEAEETSTTKDDKSSSKDTAATSSDEKKDEDDDTNNNENKPRRRFRDSLSALQIEEAKATGRAQLGLAFEMLTMMKKRAVRTDPEAYQCLIDACGRVGDTKRATELLARMHEDGIAADGVVYSCLVAAFSAESAWKQVSGDKAEDLPAWANSTSIEMDWNKLRAKKTFRENIREQINALRGTGGEEDDDVDDMYGATTYQRLKRMIKARRDAKRPVKIQQGVEFFVTEAVEVQIELGENLLEIVYPDISVDTDNETCPRCNFLLSDDDVVSGWTPNDSNDYTTSCPNCRQRFVPHFCVQSTSSTFMGSRGPASPLLCERLSPWVLQKEIRSVMSDREGVENLLSPEWREEATKNAVLWWNLVLSCMRYRFPFTFLLQGTFEQNLIAPMPEDVA
mmetsp:Transcript_26779/g.37761  ORF Transcript_26779/g.37761 Transcript_26779/m.37761 type:complete len:1407 (+) Transcript_26779:119-4339(+)